MFWTLYHQIHLQYNRNTKLILPTLHLHRIWINTLSLMNLLHGRQPHPIAIKWKKSAVFDSISSVRITIEIKIKVAIVIAIEITIAITIEIAIEIEIEITLKISIQIIIKMATTTIQNIVRLCCWTHLQCRLQFNTERWMLLSCKESSNPLLFWYSFINLISSIPQYIYWYAYKVFNHTLPAKPTNIGNSIESVFDAVSNSIPPVECLSSCVEYHRIINVIRFCCCCYCCCITNPTIDIEIECPTTHCQPNK